MLFVIDAYEKALRNMEGKLSENPWADTTAKSADQSFKAEMTDETDGLGDSIKEISSIVENINSTYETSISLTWNGVKDSIIALDNMLSLPLFPMEWWNEDRRKLLKERAFKEEGIDQAEQGHARRLAELVKRIKDLWDVGNLEVSIKELKEKYSDDARWVGNTKPDSMLKCHEEYVSDIEKTKSIIAELAENYKNTLFM